MRALVWITEGTWEACVELARTMVPGDAEVALLHVASLDAEEVASGRWAGLLGRHHREPAVPLQSVSDEEAQELLQAARAAFGRSCALVARRGRVEREVVEACADADLLVLIRDGDRHIGPKSLGPRTRFVVDHVACTVVLGWRARPTETRPPPPPHEPPPPAPHERP